MTDAPADSPRLIYFADTMCSWCYGFAPEMNRVMIAVSDRIELILQSGGLRPFGTEVLSEDNKPRFKGYRDAVHTATGQPFDDAFFARVGYVMDTEPASRAVVTMRTLNLPAAYAYMHAIQRAYFANNADIQKAEVLSAHAEAFDVPASEFAEALQSDAMRRATIADFQMAQRFQVTGYPTLVLLKGQAAYQVGEGYAKAEAVIANIERAIAHVPAAAQ